MRRALRLVLLVVLAAPTTEAAYPLAPDSDALARALHWFGERTRSDGCIGADPGGDCAHATTRDAVIALSAAGIDPASWSNGGSTPVEYLRDHRTELEAEPGPCGACRWAKTVVAVAAAGADPRAFGGYDYVARLDTYYDGVQVGAPNQINDDAWALYAYAASDDANQSKLDSVRLYLEARRNAVDGGWSWNLAPKSEPWGTATVILALRATGTAAADASLAEALAYLHSQQAASGLVLQDGAESAESSALAGQAARALGEDPSGPAWTPDGASLVDAVLGLQQADGGFLHNAQGGSTFLATTQVVPALRGVPYPFRPPRVAIAQSPAEGDVSTPFELRAVTADPDGTIERISWRLDDGRSHEGAAWTVRFERPGSHAVVLEVEDDDGVVRSLSATVRVAAQGGPHGATTHVPGTAVAPPSLAATEGAEPRAEAGSEDEATDPLPGESAVAVLVLSGVVGAVLRRRRCR